MVRLKAQPTHIDFYFQSISIPYGAIKRISDEAYSEKITGISIPYGAIKRYSAKGSYFTIFVFQFLMVRLKDKKIKNMEKIKPFQFLMVRLKVGLIVYPS